MCSEKNSGFTIIEVLVVLAILGVVAAMGFDVYSTTLQKNKLQFALNTTALNLRRAQLFSQAVSSDNQWGVQLAGNNMTVYQGSSYASRVSSADEVTSLPSGFSFSGSSDINFSKLFGYPASSVDIIINSPKGQTATIKLNAKGTVSY